MRAIIQRAFGGPEVLEPTEIDPPQPMPSEVLIRVHAVGVNPIEPMIRAGVFPLLGDPPFILGWDLSGTVEQAAPHTWRFHPGQEVFGMPWFPRPAGAYAEYVAAPAGHLARKPAGLDHVHAAALPLVGLTAWQGLVELAGLKPGQRVLIHGGAGGVGHIAIQLAKVLGAQVLTTTSAAKHDFVSALGADEVINYRKVDFTQAAGDVDVVFDLVGGDYGERSLAVLRPGGLLVTAVDRPNRELAATTQAAGRRFAGVAVEPDAAALRRLAELVDQGSLRVHVERILPLAQAARAHQLSAGGHTTGKLVLDVTQASAA